MGKSNQFLAMDPHVSIVIPARNDARALRLTLDYLERLRGIETAEIIGAASGYTEAIAVTHNADKAAVSFPTFHCRFNFVF